MNKDKKYFLTICLVFVSFYVTTLVLFPNEISDVEFNKQKELIKEQSKYIESLENKNKILIDIIEFHQNLVDNGTLVTTEKSVYKKDLDKPQFTLRELDEMWNRQNSQWSNHFGEYLRKKYNLTNH